MAALSEDDRKTILGAAYVPPDPNAPKEAPRKSWLRKIWDQFSGKTAKP